MAAEIDLLKLIDLIYEASVDMRAWDAALVAIADALDAGAMSLTIADSDTRKAPFLVAPRTNPDWLRVYFERWGKSNPGRERGLLIPVGKAYQFEDAIPRAEFARSEYYTEFYAPQGQEFMVFTNLLNGPQAIAGTGFYRSLRDGRFEAQDERLLETLAPHLQRAVALNLRLGRLEMERESAVEMLNRCAQGALLVDSDARILFANAAAEALLREGSGLCARAGRLAALLPAQTKALRTLIADGTDGIPGGMLAMPCRDGRNLTTVVLPLRGETSWLAQRPAAIVFVKDPAADPLPSPETLRLLFDLTPAQAALAREILQGTGITAAASNLGIARSTARTHLLEIFQKTGTSHQAELVRVILRQTVATRQRS